MHPNVNLNSPALRPLLRSFFFPFSAWTALLQPVCMYVRTQLCPTLCHPMNCVAHLALLSMGLSQQEYWHGLPFPPAGNLPDPGIVSPVAPTLAGRFSSTWTTWAVHSTSLYLSKCASIRRRQWHPTPVLLPGKSHGWRSLVGCTPWGR